MTPSGLAHRSDTSMTPQVTAPFGSGEHASRWSLTPSRACPRPEPGVALHAQAPDLRCQTVPVAAGTTSDTPTVEAADTDADAVTAPGVRGSALRAEPKARPETAMAMSRVARSRPRGHGHAVTATRSRPRGHGHAVTATRSRPRGHGHAVTATRSRPRGHGHAVTATRSRPRGHGHGGRGHRSDGRRGHVATVVVTAKAGWTWPRPCRRDTLPRFGARGRVVSVAALGRPTGSGMCRRCLGHRALSVRPRRCQ